MNISILPKLVNKKVIIGISGGIAAYKSLLLIRFLKKAGAEVKVIITRNGLEFVTRVTLETLSQNTIYTDVFSQTNNYSTEHISLTDWADLFIVAPATANVIGKYASGIADDALSTSLLAFSGPVVIAPAMNSKMYANFSVQKNIEYLKSNNIVFAEAPNGMLACGYEGKGRMQEPEELFRLCEAVLLKDDRLQGKRVLVTASRTEEALDPVRYLSNNSSGKMGFEIARAFAQAGADVILVAGPSMESTPIAVKRINVKSASEMYSVVMKYFSDCDVLVKSAAVADYKPIFSSEKIKKKSSEDLVLKLERTEDILKSIAELKKTNQVVVGFAMETENLIENAKKKIERKNLDFLVANTISSKNPAFKSEQNEVTIFNRKKEIVLEYSGFKYQIAQKITELVTNLMKNS